LKVYRLMPLLADCHRHRQAVDTQREAPRQCPQPPLLSLSLSLTHTHTHLVKVPKELSLSLSHTHTLTCMHTHTHTHTHAHTHTHTHTHSCAKCTERAPGSPRGLRKVLSLQAPSLSLSSSLRPHTLVAEGLNIRSLRPHALVAEGIIH
jgi:hypothetical protein